VYVSVGDSWSIPSVQSIDDTDGDISEFVVFDDGNYDLDTAGTYTLTWTSTDAHDNVATATLTLYVNPSDTFYDGVDSYYETLNNLSGEELESALYTLLNDTGTYVTTTYGDARYYLEEADAIIGDTSHLNLIYTYTLSSDTLASATWDGGTTWNREHVWAKSLFGTGSYDPTNSTRGIEADLHNLRAADYPTNSSRGNKLFSSLITMSGYGDDGNGKWYPGDDYRGDVARIIFYMDIRWDTDTVISNIGTLETFIEWAELDPVDDFERNRNTVIYSYQHNKNPFIDHPELVDLIYN
jgi:endonuclease I